MPGGELLTLAQGLPGDIYFMSKGRDEERDQHFQTDTLKSQKEDVQFLGFVLCGCWYVLQAQESLLPGGTATLSQSSGSLPQEDSSHVNHQSEKDASSPSHSSV